jgi:hypothetical protein
MIDEGLDMTSEIAKRYDGRLRAEGEVHMQHMSTVFGTGGPVGEDECGDFYGRPLSSWSALLALQGFKFDGPRQLIGFKPVWQSENHKSFFSTSSAWGLFTQVQSSKLQSAGLDVRYGTVHIKQVELAVPPGTKAASVNAYRCGKPLALESFEQDEDTVVITLSQACAINAGTEFNIKIHLSKGSEN